MALEYFDGFDDYSTAQASRYWNIFNSPGMVIGATGRNSSNALRGSPATFQGTFGKTLSNSFSTVSTGFAMRTTGFGNASNGPTGGSWLCSFYDSIAASQQVCVAVTTAGQLQAYRSNNTLLGTSSFAMVTNVFYFIEIKVVISATVGVVQINVNGVTVLNLTAQNTKATANTTCNMVLYHGPAPGSQAGGLNSVASIDIDDLYIDNAGTFYGDCRVETVLATGNGGTTNWTPLSGANWQNVSHNPATDDTNYNSDGTAGDIDLYTYPVIATASGAVQAVMTVPVMRNDSAGTVTAQSVYRSGGTNYFGATVSIPSTTYAAFPDIQVNDPNTSSPWTVAGVNACQYGIKRVT